MIDVTMGEDDELDVLQVESGLCDARHHMLNVGLLRRVDQDQPFRGRDEPDGNEAGPDVMEIVEDLERRDLLKLDIVALAAAKRFAVAFFFCRLRRGWGIR